MSETRDAETGGAMGWWDSWRWQYCRLFYRADAIANLDVAKGLETVGTPRRIKESRDSVRVLFCWATSGLLRCAARTGSGLRCSHLGRFTADAIADSDPNLR